MRMIHKYNCYNSPVARMWISREDEVRQSNTIIVTGNLARHTELSLKPVVKAHSGAERERRQEKREGCEMPNGLEQLTAYINIYTYTPTHTFIYTQIQSYPNVKALFCRQEASDCIAKRRTKTGGHKHCKVVKEIIWEHLLVINMCAVSKQQQR